jgi:dihydroorotase-like cyclic amidohydrolase
MRQALFLLALALLPLLFRGQSQEIGEANTIAFTHVTVLDMMGGPAQSDMTVIVTGNRITDVQQSQNAKILKGIKVVDATGKCMLPGLWDMHVHALRQQGFDTDNFFPLFIANGITGVREMGNSPVAMSEVRHIRKEIETGKRPGPRFFVCGPLVDGGFSGWKSTVVVTTEQQGRAVVDSLKKAGADFIKVYYQLSPKVYFSIADEANKKRIPFAGHIPEGVTAKEASNAGQKSVEHLGDDEIFSACSSVESQLR